MNLDGKAMQDRKLDARQSSAAGLPCSPSGEDFKRKRNCGAFAAGNEQVFNPLSRSHNQTITKTQMRLLRLEEEELPVAGAGGLWV